MFERHFLLVAFLIGIFHCDAVTAVQPYLSVDAYGNCQANDPSGQRHITGRCTRYANCPSARYDWDTQRKPPFTCYYTTYENFVCCPDVGLYTHPSSPAHTMRSQPYLDNRQTHTSMSNVNQPQRISEQECSSTYFGRRNRHRAKRNDDAASVVEEVIDYRNISKTQVVGGQRVNTADHPYMCALGWKSKQKISYNCGCVLIAKKFILTAAHCASIGGDAPRKVLLGGVDLDNHIAEKIRIKRIIQHPEYSQELAYNDIAVMKLSRNSRHTPACLWSELALPQLQYTALGYGQTRFAGPSSNSLLQVFLNLVPAQQCSSYYRTDDKLPRGILAGQLCAGDSSARMDTCQGDSGGPLLMRVAKQNEHIPYIVGLTSFGEGCATRTPGVYTRIAAYIDWIEEIVWKARR